MPKKNSKSPAVNKAAEPGAEAAAQPSPLDELKLTQDVLLMLYPKSRDHGNFYRSITQEDERTIYELLRERKKKGLSKKSLLIFLDTPGGSAYSAVKIMDQLRNIYEDITIGIAEEAKSSGTLMCLGADRLIMSYASELGPLDKPMPHPDNETSTISALDIVRSLDTVIDTAASKQMKLASDLLSKHSLKQDRALEVSGDFIAKLMSPLLCKEDSKMYNQALRLLTMAELYGSRFLNAYSLKWIKNDSLRERIVKNVLKRLIWEYPDHNFAICRDEVDKDLFQIVINSEDVPYWEELWDEFKRTLGTKNKVIKFL